MDILYNCPIYAGSRVVCLKLRSLWQDADYGILPSHLPSTDENSKNLSNQTIA
jgi:hypothetical protein